jgi:hypothetical protein
MSPIKSAVFRTYSLPRLSKKRYVVRMTMNPDEEEVELSPKKTDVAAKNALDYFRDARSANEKYAIYKEQADAKLREVEAKKRTAVNRLRKLSAMERMKAAAKTVMVARRMSILGTPERGGANIGTATDLKERLAKLKANQAAA